MKSPIVLVIVWTFVQRGTVHACCNCYDEHFPRNCNSLGPKAISGIYKIQPLANAEPIIVYCELATEITGGYRAYTFLPRSITRRHDAQVIVNALFMDRKNVLLKLQKKGDRSEHYTVIQPLPQFAHVNFGILINSYAGYSRPQNDFMKEYIFLGILPESIARNKNVQGFKSNGKDIDFHNCDANPNSLFAFLPNHNNKAPSNYHPNLVYEDRGVAFEWRRQAKAITSPDRMMPNEFFFLTELHFGGCGCYSSSNRWKHGFHATAIGIR